MRNWKEILLFFLFLSVCNPIYSQEVQSDEKSVVSVDTLKHLPKRATLLSTLLPGAGQIYNKKYWKVPVIYVVGGALVYSTIFNGQHYRGFRDAYNYLYENPDHSLEGYEGYNLEQLKSIKDQYRKYRDLSVIGIALLYTLNIVDATVDGYLFDFDVSDDLSLRVEPNIMTKYNYEGVLKASHQFGLKCTFNF